LAFQSKFENQLTKVENYFNQLHVDTVNDMHDRFEKVHKRNDDLEQMIKDEREERLKQTEEQLKPIKQKLKGNILINTLNIRAPRVI
jgi:oligoendopeptidase F